MQINHLGFVLVGGTDVATSGTITIYLENTSDATNLKSTTWSTAIGSMSSVYSGSLALPTGTNTPANIDITLSSPFTYTGGGIYVAYDYQGGSFSTLPATYAANSDLGAATKSASSSTTVAPTVLNQSSAFRPQLRLSYNNPYSNDVSVTGMELLYGHASRMTSPTYEVTSTIRNASNIGLTGIPVELTVTGANGTMAHDTIFSLAAGADTVITFSGLPQQNDGYQSIKVRVPTDQVTGNDSLMTDMVVSCDTLAYCDHSTPFDAIGFNTGSGIMAARYTAPHNFPLLLKGVTIGISSNSTNTGNMVYGVLLTNQGVIIATSQTVTISSVDLGQERFFAFNTPAVVPGDSSFFVGMAQLANVTTGYFPISTQYPVNIPANQIYTLPLAGGTSQTNYTTLGRLMIEAVVGGNLSTLSSDANDSLCAGDILSDTASVGYDLYNFYQNGTTAQSSASNTYSLNVVSTFTLTDEGVRNGCTIQGDTIVVNVTPSPNVSATASPSVICSGLSTTLTANGANGYTWQPGNTSGAMQVVSPNTNTTYTVTGSSNGCSGSNTVSILVIICTGIETNLNNSGIALYPNPSQGIITVERTNAQEPAQFTLYNSLGANVYEHLLNSEKETLQTGVASGLYHYAIIQHQQILGQGKLLIQE